MLFPGSRAQAASWIDIYDAERKVPQALFSSYKKTPAEAGAESSSKPRLESVLAREALHAPQSGQPPGQSFCQLLEVSIDLLDHALEYALIVLDQVAEELHVLIER
jgi:hypothetical protein